LAARRFIQRGEEKTQAIGLYLTVAVSFLGLLPLEAYLLLAYPDWSYNYLVLTDDLPRFVPYLLISSYPLAAICGNLSATMLILKGLAKVASAFAFFLGALLLGYIFFMGKAFLFLGAYTEWQLGAAEEPLATLLDHFSVLQSPLAAFAALFWLLAILCLATPIMLLSNKR
jgi:hypothetical protein